MMEKDEFVSFIAFDANNPTQDSTYYFEHRDKKIQPLWVNFIFGAFWFLYRRMYLVFFLVYFVLGYGMQYYFSSIGYDWGASGAYSTMILNVFTVFFGHGLYIPFVMRKMKTLKHLGTHVRLFTPFSILVRNIFAILIIQIFCIWFKMDFIISWVYPFLYISFIYMVALYIYYFVDWINS